MVNRYATSVGAIAIGLIGSLSMIGSLAPGESAKYVAAAQADPVLLAAAGAEVEACKKECKKQEKACKDRQPRGLEPSLPRCAECLATK